jgi:hypothetical protein
MGCFAVLATAACTDGGMTEAVNIVKVPAALMILVTPAPRRSTCFLRPAAAPSAHPLRQPRDKCKHRGYDSTHTIVFCGVAMDGETVLQVTKVTSPNTVLTLPHSEHRSTISSAKVWTSVLRLDRRWDKLTTLAAVNDASHTSRTCTTSNVFRT